VTATLGKKRIKGILNMTHFSNRLGAILIGVAVAIPAFADIPVNLRGTWVVDGDATVALLKKSPDWNEEEEQMLPMMQRMWASMSMTITADSISASRGKGKSDTVTADLVSTKKAGHILKITDENDKVTRAAFQFIPQDRLRVLTGKNKSDQGGPIWKRGQPTQDAPSSLEVFAEAMSLASQANTKADNTTHSKPAVQSVAKKQASGAGETGSVTNEISKVVLGMYHAVVVGDYDAATKYVSKEYKERSANAGGGLQRYWGAFLFESKRGKLDLEKTYIRQVKVDSTDANRFRVAVMRVYKSGKKVMKFHYLVKDDGKWKVTTK
jgi:hypothetical protein